MGSFYITVLMGVGLLFSYFDELHSQYEIAYACLGFSILTLVMALIFFISDDVNSWLRNYLWERDAKTDRRWLVGVLILGSALFAFGFFVFYPQFERLG